LSRVVLVNLGQSAVSTFKKGNRVGALLYQQRLTASYIHKALIVLGSVIQVTISVFLKSCCLNLCAPICILIVSIKNKVAFVKNSVYKLSRIPI